MDLTVIDETGARTEQVNVPNTVATGRIASRLAQLMGLPGTEADGRPIPYGFRHESSGRQILKEETLAQAKVNEHDVLRLVTLASAQVLAAAPGYGATPQRQPGPTPHTAHEPRLPPATTVLSPEPPPPSRQPPSSGWGLPPYVAIALTALVIAAVGVAVALIISRGGNRSESVTSLAHNVLTYGATPTTTSSEPEADEPTTNKTAAPPTEGTLPAVSTQQMATEIQQTLRTWHEEVVEGNYHAAWELLSQRKQTQAEGEHGGYATWARNQATLRPYLDPADLQVSVQSADSSSGVAQVDVTGMTWDKPGASCSEWSGITWVKYEDGEWRYDPGYSTTQQREREWASRYSELLGGSC